MSLIYEVQKHDIAHNEPANKQDLPLHKRRESPFIRYGLRNSFLTHQTSISHCVPVLDFSVSVLADFSCLKMSIISLFGQ